MSNGKLRSAVVTMSLGEYLKKYKLSKKQGMLDSNRVERFAENIYDVVNSPTNPVTVDAGGNIISGNHRTAAAILVNEKGELNLQHAIRIVVLEKEYTPLEIASMQVRANNDNATNKRREQTALNPAIPVSLKVILPLFNSVEKSVSFIRRAALLELIVKVGAMFNNNPILFGVFSAEGKVDLPGAEIYRAKSLDEAKALGILEAKAHCDLRNQEIALNAFKDATLAVDRFMTYCNEQEKTDGGKIADLIGQSRTTFLYVMMGAAISGRLNNRTYASIYKKLSKMRSKVKSRLHSFPNDPDKAEQAISDMLGLGVVSVHESFEAESA
jgi:hypothetical protein